MGRKRKHSLISPINSSPRKGQACWIETCTRGSYFGPVEAKEGVTIRITRVELCDNHLNGLIGTSNATNELKVVASKVIQADENQIEINENDTVAQDVTAWSKDSEENICTVPQSNDATVTTSQSILIPTTPVKDEKKITVKPFVRIVIDASASEPIQKVHQHRLKLLPKGNCGDGVVNPFGNSKVAHKYWAQRKRLFTRFDEGIMIDEVGFYSVTPELIAAHIAKRMLEMTKNSCHDDVDTQRSWEDQRLTISCSREDRHIFVMDAFCGWGGNVIAFSRCRSTTVIAIDIDRNRLRSAAKNCAIYGVPSSAVIFIEADSLQVLRDYYKDGKLIASRTNSNVNCENCHGYTIGGVDLLSSTVDVIFLSPPWGGPNYLKAPLFTLSDMKLFSCKIEDHKEHQVTYTGSDLLTWAASASTSKNVIFYLPRNMFGNNLGRCALTAGYRRTIEMEQIVLNGKLKCITAYLSE